MVLARVGLILFTLLAFNCPSFGQDNKYTRIHFNLGDVSPYSIQSLPPMYTNSHPGDLILLLDRITAQDPAVALTMMNAWHVPNPTFRFISFTKDDGMGPWTAEVTTMDGISGKVGGKPEGAITFREWLIQNGFEGVEPYYNYLMEVTKGKRATLNEIEAAGREVNKSGGFTTDAGEANARVDGLNNKTAPVMGEPSEFTFARLVPKPPAPPEPPPAPVVEVPIKTVEQPPVKNEPLGVADVVSGKATFAQVLAEEAANSESHTRIQKFGLFCRMVFLGY